MKKTLGSTLAIAMAVILGICCTSPVAADAATDALYQDETVYVITGNDGSQKKMIVSDKLKNEATGTSAVTQKTISSEAPIALNVTYSMDGTEMSADKISGRSGHAAITYNYTNRETRTVTVNGVQSNACVPFLAMTVMILDRDQFSNITVEGGRLIDDGVRSMAIGISVPGLADVIGEDVLSDETALSGNMTVEADVRSLSVPTTYTLVTPFPLDKVSSEGAELRSTLSGLTEQLGDALTQLCNGADQLNAGLGQAAQGSEALSAGLDTLAGNNTMLNAGAQQVFAGLLANADSSLAAAGLTLPALTIENYSTVLTQVIGMVGANSAAGMKIAALKQSLDQYNTFYMGLQAYTAGVANAAAGAAELSTGLETLSTGSTALSAGIHELSNELTTALSTLTEGKAASLINSLEVLSAAAADYKSVNGLGDAADGSVKFIYKTEAVR